MKQKKTGQDRRHTEKTAASENRTPVVGGRQVRRGSRSMRPPTSMGFALRVMSVLLLLPLLCMLRCSSEQSGREPLSEDEHIVRAVADAVLRDTLFRVVDRGSGRVYGSPAQAPANADLRLGSRYNDWRYWNGVLNIGMSRLGEVVDDSAYIEFSRRNVEFAFDSYGYFEARYNGEEKWDYPFGQRFLMEELDDCGAMGASVIDVYRHDRQERYGEYIKQVALHIGARQHRLDDGTVVRSFPRRWTLWADDLYMCVPFLARMGELSGRNGYSDDAARQVVNFYQHLFSREKALMAHFWYSDTARSGFVFWGRANGWALMAQVELLDRLSPDHSFRTTLLGLLERHIGGIVEVQSESGLWHQVLDKPDSYLETSCSAMFTYAIARAVNKGYVHSRFAAAARLGWAGVRSRIRSDGKIEGICAGTIVSDDIAYYYSRPTPLNDVHGTGAVLLAGAEILDLGKGAFPDTREPGH